MAPLAWPSILIPSSEIWNVNKAASRGGGRSLTNQEQVVVGPSGYVTASLTIPCITTAKVLAMRALLAALDGRAGTVLVGPFEIARAPWFVDSMTGGKITDCRGRADAVRDPAWNGNQDASAALDFRLAGPIGMNATAMSIQRNRGGLLVPGMLFSIAGRLHMITELRSPDAGAEVGYAKAGTIDIAFRPWSRDAYPAATVIEFGRPVCTMRLGSDETGAMELQLSRFGTVTLDFVEAF